MNGEGSNLPKERRRSRARSDDEETPPLPDGNESRWYDVDASFVSIRVCHGGLMKLSHLSVRDLEALARNVELQIKKLHHRPRLTPSEHSLSAALKKERLTLKDRLDALR
jgi:hypothetical protein